MGVELKTSGSPVRVGKMDATAYSGEYMMKDFNVVPWSRFVPPGDYFVWWRRRLSLIDCVVQQDDVKGFLIKAKYF